MKSAARLPLLRSVSRPASHSSTTANAMPDAARPSGLAPGA